MARRGQILASGEKAEARLHADRSGTRADGPEPTPARMTRSYVVSSLGGDRNPHRGLGMRTPAAFFESIDEGSR